MTVPAAIRRPAVAGYFYPDETMTLRREVNRSVPEHPHPAVAVPAAIAPHGSFLHAGAVLGATFGGIKIPRRCIALGASHTGSWMPWSLMMSGAYQTPLGEVPIDETCAEALQQRCPFLTPDGWGQRGEHAIEVLVPFLQVLGPSDLTLVPIISGSDDPIELSELAAALTSVIRMQEEPVLVIASSDLSHYEPEPEGRVQDEALIKAVCALDRAALWQCVREEGMLMCGANVVAVAMETAEALGATRGTLLSYGTSAMAGGDPHSAIGYAGIALQ